MADPIARMLYFISPERHRYRVDTMMPIIKSCLASMLAGTVYVAVLYGLFGHSTDGNLSLVVLAASVMMFGTGLVLELFGRVSVFITSVFVFAGLCSGVVVDAVIGSLFVRAERNLFPIEIALLAIIGAPGFIAGAIVGLVARRVSDRR